MGLVCRLQAAADAPAVWLHELCAFDVQPYCSRALPFRCPPLPLPLTAERVRWQREQALTGASMAELEALLQRAAALLEAAGIRCVAWQGAC